jgi:hypothetical protein
VTASLTPEDRALLCAANPVLCPERQQQLAWLLATPLDWPGLIASADRHGVAALLHTHIRFLGSDRIPPTARETLAVRARACVAWNLRLGHELSRLLTALGQAGIPVIPLKGPVLAAQLYPDPLLRFSADLDLLVRHHDCAAGERTLRQAGYRRSPAHEQGADYHTIFVSEDAAAGGVAVELHHELGERHVSGPDVRVIWASASASMWEGHPIWSMALPDLLLYLCVHAAKDGLASIKALLDITLLVERYQDTLPWKDLVARVKTARVSSPVYLALSQSRMLLGAPVPDRFLDAIRPRHLSWPLAHALFKWRGGVLHAPGDLLVGPFMALLMFLWEDSLRGQLRHVRRNLLPSASLRARWTSLAPSAPWVIWYPAWLWHATRHATRQLIPRSSVEPPGPPPA